MSTSNGCPLFMRREASASPQTTPVSPRSHPASRALLRTNRGCSCERCHISQKHAPSSTPILLCGTSQSVAPRRLKRTTPTPTRRGASLFVPATHVHTRALYLAAEMAATISANSGLSEAPPTRKPSMSGMAERSGAFFAFAEPPYWMRMPSATASPHSLRM